MLEKIYSKITRERKKEFQIETCIYLEDSEKRVMKRALADSGVQHIQGINSYYIAKKDTGLLCPILRSDEKSLSFRFMEGTDLCSLLIQAAEKRDREEFEELLRIYRGLLEKSVSAITDKLEESEERLKIFGGFSCFSEEKYASIINLDLTFDNIIKEKMTQKFFILDYEWVFHFSLPINFVVYRAVLAFYIRYGSIANAIMTFDEMLEFFKVSPGAAKEYEKLNVCFNSYVYGKEEGYNAVLQKYKKQSYNFLNQIQDSEHFLQIFLDNGRGYLEEESYKQIINGRKAYFSYNISDKKKVKFIRFDLLNRAFIAKNVKIYIEDESGNISLSDKNISNAKVVDDKYWVFIEEDPQIIVDVKKQPKRVWGEYEVLTVFSQEEFYALKRMKEIDLMEISKLLNEREAIAAEKEKQEIRNIQLENQNIALKNEAVQLKSEYDRLKDEIAYIKSSKIYRALLKGKVEKNFKTGI